MSKSLVFEVHIKVPDGLKQETVLTEMYNRVQKLCEDYGYQMGHVARVYNGTKRYGKP